ncbi:MAG: hypothetical protein V1788_01795 [Nanoarchaeota archaeon]
MKKSWDGFKPLYIKKFGTRGKFVIWVVDGNYVRTYIDEEFTNYGQHYRFKSIPKNEFWLDHEANEGEANYFIDSMLVVNRLMAKGVSHKKAVEAADRVERRERHKSKVFRRFVHWIFNSRKVPKEVYKKLLQEFKGIKVWLVNGELVRDIFYIDFSEGGHDKVYFFVPEKEIWIDDDITPHERKFVLLHELHERILMAKGMKYIQAHESSSKIESFCRHQPDKFKKIMKKEIEKIGN